MQPQDVLPASTDAFLRIDLDPSASQKIDLFKLIRKVPDLADQAGITSDKQDLRELVFKQILTSECKDVDYEKDVEPWLGDRLGVGGDVEDKKFLIAVQTTDEDASRAGIKKLFGCADETYGVGYTDGYAIIAPEQKDVDAAIAATAKSSLADNKKFVKDFDALGNPGIASGWADLEEISKAPGVADSLGGQTKELAKAGTVATALRADGSAIELAVLSGSTTKGDDKAVNLADLPADTVAALSVAGLGDQVTEGFDSFVEELDKGFGSAFPSNQEPQLLSPDPAATIPTPGAPDPDFSLDGDGDSDTIATPIDPSTPTPAVPTLPEPTTPVPTIPEPITPAPDGLGLDDDFGSPGAGGAQGFIDQIERETGFKLPEDLATLFGDNLTLAIGSKNLENLPNLSGPDAISSLDVGLALTSDKTAALDLVQRLATSASDAGIPLVASATDDGAVLATNKGAADAIASPDGSLGDKDAFKSVIPDGDSASGGFYLDIGTILDKVLEADPPQEVRDVIESASALSAIGVSTGQQDGDRTLTRMRIAFK